MKLLRTLKLKLIKKLSPTSATPIIQEERYLMIIIKKLLNLKESELLMTPNMSKFYITLDKNNDKSGIFVVIDFTSNVTSIINHKFGYDIKMSSRVSSYIMTNFITKVEERRENMEKEYRSNIQYSLSTVLENINTRIKNENQ